MALYPAGYQPRTGGETPPTFTPPLPPARPANFGDPAVPLPPERPATFGINEPLQAQPGGVSSLWSALAALFGGGGGTPPQGMTGMLADPRGQAGAGTDSLGNPRGRF